MKPRFLLLALGVAALGLSYFMAPKPAAADTLSWNVTSVYPYTVQLEFYSQNYNRGWPGNDMAYDLHDSRMHHYNLNCRTGEKICLGAWSKGDPSIYWGVGQNDHYCSSCCRICGGSGGNDRLQE